MSIIENSYNTVSDDHLTALENVKGGHSVFCDEQRNPARFVQETVTDILSDDDRKTTVIFFRRTIERKKAKNIASRILRRLHAVDRTRQIQTMYDVPTDLYALLKKENTFTERERSVAIHAFLDQLNALRGVLPINADLVKHLGTTLNGWDREWIEEVVAYDPEKEWEIPIITTVDATAVLKLAVAQIERRSN